MPSKKKKYNARFPAGRIKKIMQSDEEIGKVAQAVPVIISRTLELFVESLLTKTLKITNSRNAKTLSTSHMKQCIMSEQRFDFLRELVKNIPDISVAEEAAGYNEDDVQSSPEDPYPDSDTPYDLSMPSTSTRATRLSIANGDLMNNDNRTTIIQNGSNITSHEDQRRAHIKRETDIIQRLQQRVGGNLSVASASASGQSSVIKHTKTLSNDCPPNKLARSDSTPTDQYYQHRHRFKHQSQSVPNNVRNIANQNSTSTTYISPTSSQQQQQQKIDMQNKQPPLIPAPIVSIDFCNKPVVKIDYSKIPLAATSVTPLSAPANMSDASSSLTSAFDFNAEPIINIDLTNIVTNTTKSTETTITLPSVQPKTAATSKSSFFELDEDYDNI